MYVCIYLFLCKYNTSSSPDLSTAATELGRLIYIYIYRYRYIYRYIDILIYRYTPVYIYLYRGSRGRELDEAVLQVPNLYMCACVCVIYICIYIYIHICSELLSLRERISVYEGLERELDETVLQVPYLYISIHISV